MLLDFLNFNVRLKGLMLGNKSVTVYKEINPLNWIMSHIRFRVFSICKCQRPPAPLIQKVTFFQICFPSLFNCVTLIKPLQLIRFKYLTNINIDWHKKHLGV